MAEAEPRILLVTPVWNDSARLAVFGTDLAAALAKQARPIHWLIADDGSSPADRERLAVLRAEFAAVYPRVDLHLAGDHLGKGGTVREAWELPPDSDWLTFVDADGSAPPAEVIRLIEAAIANDCSTLGLRKRTATTQVVESPWRGLAHRGFILAVHLILGLRCQDPQCGLKVLKGPDYRRIAPQLVENGLAFDSEMLATLDRSGACWTELPVTWIQKGDGKVRPMRDAWGMLAALFRIRGRLGQLLT